MRQITEVLRLAAQGLSYRQIGQSLNVSPSTVQGYVKRAQRVGLSWPLPDDLDGFGLEERLFTRSEEELSQAVRNLIGWRSTASGSAPSTSRCSCCGWSTSRPIRRA